MVLLHSSSKPSFCPEQTNGSARAAGPAAPAALKENAASLKGRFSYLQPVDDLEVLKPES